MQIEAVAVTLLIARLALAAVFFLAGVTKLADRAGSRAAMIGFGVPAALAGPLGVVLPVAELVVALALLPRASVSWGALGALVLLGLFIAGIANVMIRGRETDCHCFGQLHSSPVGWSTMGRNAALALIAGFVLVGERGGAAPSDLNWFGGLGTTEWVTVGIAGFALVVLAGSGWFGMHLLRQHGRLLLRMDALERELAERGLISAPSGVTVSSPDGLPIGTPGPAFDAPNLQGGSTPLGELLAPGLPLILVFGHPGCSPCTAALPEIAGWQRAHGAALTIALISQGTLEENRLTAAASGVERVLLQREREIADAYVAYATPSAVLLSPDGSIASAVVQGAVAIRGLVGTVVPGLLAVSPVPDDGNGRRKGAPPLRDIDQAVMTRSVSLDVH